MYEYDPKTAVPYLNSNGVLVKPPQRLTHQYLLEHRLPLYVLATFAPQAHYTLTIRRGAGQASTALRIPRSKVPYCVTDQVSAKLLRENGQDLWAGLSKGVLVLVWPSDAERMGTNMAAAEQQRTQLSRWSTLNTTKSKEMMVLEQTIVEAQDATRMLETEVSDDTQNPINARVMDIVSRSVAGEVKLDQAIREFSEMEDTLTDHDLSYAIANVRGGKLRGWLQGRLATAVKTKPTKPKTKATEIKEEPKDDYDIFGTAPSE